MATAAEYVLDRRRGKRECRCHFLACEAAGRKLADEDGHRLLPLSNGQPDGDNMVCAYLALMFGLDDQCVKRRLGEPPAGARVRSYDAIDWAELVWIWIEGSADAPGQTERGSLSVESRCTFLEAPPRRSVIAPLPR
jgi:hypothetical protein